MSLCRDALRVRRPYPVSDEIVKDETLDGSRLNLVTMPRPIGLLVVFLF